TRPTRSRLGLAEPLSTPAAFLSRSAAGGVLVIKVKERSAYTVITTGIVISPMLAVLALKVLQNSIMLTPCWPRAGPIGGAGLPLPEGHCSLISEVIFLAILEWVWRACPSRTVTLPFLPESKNEHYNKL